MTVKNIPACLRIGSIGICKQISTFLLLMVVLSGQLAAGQSLNVDTIDDVQKQHAVIIPIAETDEITDNVDEQLSQIITSEDYAKSREKTTWQYIESNQEQTEDSWWIELLEKIIDFLFDNEIDSSNPFINILPFLIKLALVLALVFFVVWVVRQAIKNAWFASISHSLRKRATVSTFSPQQLPQSWENLPDHSLIPQVVQDLLNQRDYEQAASVLYRGSLRWLKQTQHVFIAPATTEKQCLNQIKQLSSMSKNDTQPSKSFNTHGLNRKDSQISLRLSLITVNYLTKLIYLWLEAAYGQGFSNKAFTSQSANVNQAMNSDLVNRRSDKLKNLLLELSQQWLETLPINSKAASVVNDTQGDR